MQLAYARPLPATQPRIKLLLEDLDALTDAAIQEIRTTSYLLHAPLLDECRIASAARWFIDGFAKRSGIQVDCTFRRQWSAHLETVNWCCSRVLQESLTNVHRYSGASAASIKLRRENGHLTLK